MKRKIFKKIISLVISVVMCFNVHAAIVGDSDGAAFINKREFEALKTDFNTQIDNYNTSIDNKIDGAIASYLVGVNLMQEPNNLFDIYKGSHGSSPRFYWAVPGIGVKTHLAKIDCFFDKEFAYKVYNNIAFGGYFYYANSSPPKCAVGAGLYFDTEPNWQGPGSGWTTLWRGGKYVTAVDSNDNWFSKHSLGTWSYWNSGTTRTSEIRTSLVNTTNTIDPGAKPVWTMLENNGKKSLYLYQTTSLPYLVLTVHRHVYKDFASLTTSYYMETDGKKDYDTTNPTITATTVTSYGEKTYGTNYTGTSTDIGNYIKVNLQRMETSNGIDYRNVVFPVSGDSIWYVSTTPTIQLETSYTTQQIEDIYWYDICFPNLAGGALQSNTLYGPKLRYYRPYYEATQTSIRTFEIPYVSSLAGETIYHGQGFPILQATSEDTDCTVTIKIKNSLNNNNPVRCLFSDKKLVNGTSFDTTAGIQKTVDINCNTDYSIDFEGIGKDAMIWFNPISGPGDYAYIDSVTVKAK